MPGTRRLNVFERHSPSGMFWVNRTAQKMVAVKDPNCSEVTRIIADGHRLANIGRQSGIDITQPPKVHTVAANHAGLRHHDQQQVQLLQTLRHTRQPSLAQPGLDWCQAGFTMGAIVIIPQEIVTYGSIELWQREPWWGSGLSLAKIARECGETFRIQGPEKALNFPSALRPSNPGIDKLETEVCCDLIEMRAGEITAMIDVKHIRDTADGPRGVLLAPHRLVCRRFQVDQDKQEPIFRCRQGTILVYGKPARGPRLPIHPPRRHPGVERHLEGRDQLLKLVERQAREIQELYRARLQLGEP